MRHRDAGQVSRRKLAIAAKPFLFISVDLKNIQINIDPKEKCIGTKKPAVPDVSGQYSLSVISPSLASIREPFLP